MQFGLIAKFERIRRFIDAFDLLLGNQFVPVPSHLNTNVRLLIPVNIDTLIELAPMRRILIGLDDDIIGGDLKIITHA